MKGYDEKYLQSCIDKAKKSWEGVDTDKFMNEIRGREGAPSEELDDVAIRKAIDYTDGIEDGGTEKHPWNDEDVETGYINGFKAGAEWQWEQYECIPAEEAYMRGFAQGAKEERKDLTPLINRLCEAILFEWKDAADLARKTLTQIKAREE